MLKPPSSRTVLPLPINVFAPVINSPPTTRSVPMVSLTPDTPGANAKTPLLSRTSAVSPICPPVPISNRPPPIVIVPPDIVCTPLPASLNVPSLTTVSPRYTFAPLNTTRPVPVFSKAASPERTALTSPLRKSRPDALSEPPETNPPNKLSVVTFCTVPPSASSPPLTDTEPDSDKAPSMASTSRPASTDAPPP